MKKIVFLISMCVAIQTGSCTLEPIPDPCTLDEHDEDGKCVPNSSTSTACGYPEVNCLELEGFLFANCVDGQCSASQCKEKYHKIKKDTESKLVSCAIDTVTDCGPTLADCTSNGGVKETQCIDGICVASECDSNFIKHNGACLSAAVENCGSPPINCMTKFSNYREISCTNQQQCELISCDIGFHINNNDCEQDTLEACGGDSKKKPVNCSAMIGQNHIDSIECQKGRCQITQCETDYEIADEDRCE